MFQGQLGARSASGSGTGGWERTGVGSPKEVQTCSLGGLLLRKAS